MASDLDKITIYAFCRTVTEIPDEDLNTLIGETRKKQKFYKEIEQLLLQERFRREKHETEKEV